MEFNEKLLLLEKRYLEYRGKTKLTDNKAKCLTFEAYMTILFLDDTQDTAMNNSSYTAEEELLDSL